MKILFLTSDSPNYLEDCVYGGLAEVLGAAQVVDFPPKPIFHVSTESRFAKPYIEYTFPPPPALSFDQVLEQARGGEFDVIVVGAWRKPAQSYAPAVLEKLTARPPVVFLDGEDGPDEHSREAIESGIGEVTLYAKREFEPDALSDLRTVPLPFACPDRHLPCVETEAKPDDICWLAKAWSHPVRPRIAELLRSMNLRGEIGDIGRSKAEYAACLGRAKIGVNGRGRGFDTLRYWEIPFFRAMLLSELPSILIPHNFQEGETAVFFANDLSDLEDRIRRFLTHEDERREIAEAGRAHLLRHHTISARAGQLLRLLEAAKCGLPGLALARARWIFSCGWREGRQDLERRNPGGASDGWIDEAEFLAEPIRDLAVGVEIGPENRKVSATAIGVGPPGEAVDILGRAEALPFPDGSLDYVVANHVIEHCVDPVAVLQEWKRALRRGGVIGLVVPDSRHVDTFSLNPEHKHETTPDIVRTWVAEAGGCHILKEGLPTPRWSCGVVVKTV